MYDLAQSRTYQFATNTEDTVLKFSFNLCLKIKPSLGTNLSEKPCRSERKRKLRETRCKSETNIKTVGTLLLLNRDNGLKYRSPRILIGFKCRNSLLDYLDTVDKSIEKKMQESITTKL